MSRVVPPGIWEVEAFARCLSLRDLAILSCARKDWQASIILLYSSSRTQQLVQALDTCLHGLNRVLEHKKLSVGCLTAPAPSKVLQQLWAVVSYLQGRWSNAWGPALAAAPGLPEDLTQLFTVPGLPSDALQYFVKNVGVRITYRQLIEAARQQVASIECWVRAQELLNMKTDLPDVVVAVCFGGMNLQLDQVRSQSQEEKEDILQLVVNCNCCLLAESIAAEVLPGLTDPIKLARLLQTAVTRGHYYVLEPAVASPAACQMTPAAVLQLMQAAQPTIYTSAGTHLKCIGQLPAAATIAAADLVPVMQAAVARRCGASMLALCTFPAAHRIPVDAYVSMLKQALSQEISCDLLRALSSLSVAARVPADDMVALMKLALARPAYEDLELLCKMPAAQQIPWDFYSSALEYAVKRHTKAALAALCSLPAASKVDASQWVSLMELSLLIEYQGKAITLCDMPTASQISPADMVEVLSEALSRQRLQVVEALCKLPAAQQIPPDRIPGLVELVESRLKSTWYDDLIDPFNERYPYDDEDDEDDYYYDERAAEQICKTLQLLSSLDPVQHMGAADFCELVKVLVQLRCREKTILQMWFKCPAAHSMPADMLTQQMQQAIERKDHDLLKALCQIPAAAACMKDVDTWLQLINRAVEVADGGDSKYLLQSLATLPATSLLSSKQLAGVLSAIVKSNRNVVPRLCQIPAAASLPSATVAGLLCTAVGQNHIANVQQLCKMQVATNLSCDLVENLLLAAVEKNSHLMVEALRTLPGAAQIFSVKIMIDRALHRWNSDIIEQLCQLPAAQNVTAQALVHYLDRAVRTGSGLAVCTLCQLLNAHCIQQQAVLELIQTAVQKGNTLGLHALCRLRAAHRISPATLLKLSQKAAKQHDSDAVLVLLQLLERVQLVKQYFGHQSC